MEQWYIKVIFRDGDSSQTRINGDKETILSYYSGMERVEGIEFIERLK